MNKALETGYKGTLDLGDFKDNLSTVPRIYYAFYRFQNLGLCKTMIENPDLNPDFFGTPKSLPKILTQPEQRLEYLIMGICFITSAEFIEKYTSDYFKEV